MDIGEKIKVLEAERREVTKRIDAELAKLRVLCDQVTLAVSAWIVENGFNE